MAERGIASEIVRYQPRNFKHWPPYAGIAENMLTNATLPSVVFGGGSCSQKWKAAPQDAWTAQLGTGAPLLGRRRARVVKLIGYDASGRDTQRYHHAIGCEDPRYAYRYPLREWAWARAGMRGAHRARRPPHPAEIELLLLRQHQTRRGAGAFDRGAAHHRADGGTRQPAPPQRRRPMAQAGVLAVAARRRVPAASPSSSANAASLPAEIDHIIGQRLRRCSISRRRRPRFRVDATRPDGALARRLHRAPKRSKGDRHHA